MSRPIPIEPGQRFGRLTIIRYDRTENGLRYVFCRCDCGTEKSFQLGKLRSGKTTSCGCYRREVTRARATKIPIEPGHRFGRLTVIRETDPGPNNQRRFVCRCDCGTEKATRLSYLRGGQTMSCGCYQREKARETGRAKRKHGHAGRQDGQGASRTYHVWCRMRKSCRDPNDSSYHLYGGRGIRVCHRWKSFANFLADMGEIPDSHSLDRKNQKRDFSPSNCLYVPRRERYRNRLRS